MERLPELCERYDRNIQGTLSCFDRVVLFGSFGNIAHPEAMSWELKQAGVRLLDYTKGFANDLRLEVKAHVEQMALKHGVQIQFVNYGIRKEALIESMLATRGRAPGVVGILSCMEKCSCFKVTKNHKTGFLQLSWDSGKCLHYYIYIMDKDYGLCYLRIPTWMPCRLQFYFNGHDWLEAQMKRRGITFRKLDNCFVDISDYRKAQALADRFDPIRLHRRLDRYARDFCSVYQRWPAVHWSITQIEYATDLVFKSDRILPALYQELVRSAVNEVEAADIYCFMGKRLTVASGQDVSSRLNTRIEGTRIKHSIGHSSIKMYDKQDRVLRIETTTHDLSFFKHYRKVIKRDGQTEMKHAAVKKTIHSIGIIAELLGACNRRYYQYISQMQDHTSGKRKLNDVSEPVIDEQDRRHRGINFFDRSDRQFINTLVRGEHNISGFTNRALQKWLPDWSSGKISRMIRRFRAHKLIKNIRKTYKYYLTKKGQSVLFAHLQLINRVIIPGLST